MTMPATRIGRTIIFPGGATITISHLQRILYALKVKKTATPPFNVWR